MRLATLRSSVVVAMLLSSTLVAQQRSPTLIIDRRGVSAPPGSLEQAVWQSDLVAVIRIVGEQSRGLRVPATAFRAQVVEVIKNAGVPVGSVIREGSEIMIHRDGGLVDDGKGTPAYLEERGFPLWRPGTTLVTFLSWLEDQKMFYLTYGPDSSIEQDAAGSAKTFGIGRAAKDQHGKRFDEVLARIRAAHNRK